MLGLSVTSPGDMLFGKFTFRKYNVTFNALISSPLQGVPHVVETLPTYFTQYFGN